MLLYCMLLDVFTGYFHSLNQPTSSDNTGIFFPNGRFNLATSPPNPSNLGSPRVNTCNVASGALGPPCIQGRFINTRSYNLFRLDLVDDFYLKFRPSFLIFLVGNFLCRATYAQSQSLPYNKHMQPSSFFPSDEGSSLHNFHPDLARLSFDPAWGRIAIHTPFL